MVSELQRVLHEFSAATGIAPWPASDVVHVEVDGTTAALMYDDEARPDVLICHFDLGTFEHAGMHRHLLERNLLTNDTAFGRFGLVAGSDKVVYALEVPVGPQLHGSGIPGLLSQSLQAAKTSLMS